MHSVLTVKTSQNKFLEKSMVTTLNTGNSQRVTRRIIAEDNDWTLQVSFIRKSSILDP